MPFFRENLDNDNVHPPAAEADLGPRPVPIHGLSQTRRHAPARSLAHRVSEESIRTDLCEGPLQEAPGGSKPRSPEPELCVTTTSDRAELIERLKRGESPTWVPNRRLDSYFSRHGSRDHSPGPRTKSRGSPGLLSAAMDDTTDGQRQETDTAERMQQGLDIERPRSALHSGDFTQHASSSRYDEPRVQDRRAPDADVFSSDRPASWFATSPPRDFAPFKRIPFPDLPDGYKSSPPSLSSSLSSSFVYKHPTSPLVQSESNDDLNINAMDLDPGTPSRAPRRQTLHTFTSSQTAPLAARGLPVMRRESTFPYQAHQPRKSLTSAPTFPSVGHSSLQTSPYGSRRPSVALESAPSLPQTSMVGSYEESILRGRMSTTPSKPLDFLAQIGVLGLGNCKSSLRCPTHVTLPFSAVFYSYASTPHGRSKNADGPSPYVGQIDLENGLPNPEDSRARRRSHQRSGSAARRSRAGSVDVDMGGVEASGPDVREVAKARRRGGGGGSPKAPPGGSYRIPEKGQIQIIIKNQNKTAVKLFLIPYDLAGMEPGTKTFIRQRSYSGGSVVEDARDATQQAPAAATPAEDHPVLRYLVHLHICCPAKGRYYLYKSLRVVFANRVPDGKEKLRNEITLPEPRWTPYKAVRQMLQHPPLTTAAAQQQHHHQQQQQLSTSLTADRAFPRRTSGFSFGQMMADGFDPTTSTTKPVPVSMPQLPAFELRARAVSLQDRGGTTVPQRPLGGVPPPTAPVAGFAPLNFAKGEFGAFGGGGGGGGGGSGGGGGGLVGASSAAVAEGLLSQRLRSLGMRGVCRGELADRKVAEGGERQ